MKRVLLLLVAIATMTVSCKAQPEQPAEIDARYTEEDVARFNEVMSFLADSRDASMPETVIKVAKHLVGTPYVAYTLEIEPEQLTVNTRETDCILFVEMCLAMSLTSKEENPSFEKYCDNLRNLRYRDGVVDGYASRLHYTSEWILQGESRGIFHEITGEIGGKPYDQKFSFMSTHPDSYKQLKNDPAQLEKIKEVEKNLERHDYFVIAKSDLGQSVPEIKNGDIVCFNDSHEGLDIAHVGYAYWKTDDLHFIHASFTRKQVIINETPLVDYTNGVKGHNGLRVVRLAD